MVVRPKAMKRSEGPLWTVTRAGYVQLELARLQYLKPHVIFLVHDYSVISILLTLIMWLVSW